MIATLADETVTLRRARPYQIAADLIGLAGDVQPGPGRSIAIPLDQLVTAAGQADGDTERFAELLATGGLPAGQASTLARINTGHRRSGQFTIAAADHDNTLRATGHPLGFVDTEQGRWAQRRTATANGQDWITITPVTTAQLGTMLNEQLDAAR